MNYNDIEPTRDVCPRELQTGPINNTSSGGTLAAAALAMTCIPVLGIALAAMYGALYVTEKMEEQK